MKNNNISEEIISGWRSEANDYLNEHEQFASALGERIAIRAFIAAKTSSHERILELENNVEMYKAAFSVADEKWQSALVKLTKRDELLRRSLQWNEAMLKIAIISIDEEKQRAEATSQLYQLIANIKQLEQEK